MTKRQFEKILKDNGFELIRNSGHIIYRRGADEMIAIPRHNPNKMMAKRILKEFGITEVK